MQENCFGDGPFVFRMNEHGSGPQLLTQVCLERGWREYNVENGDTWNLWWKNTGFPLNHHQTLFSWQFINHIPKGSAICRKDNLARHLRYMKSVYGAIYNFSPHGYNLPLEYSKLAHECSRRRTDHSDLNSNVIDCPVWIYKPVAQSQGRGIFLFRKLSELTYDSTAIVQRYIEKPLLIGGYKFDLRLYVCIPSFHPFTVYLYKEGLVRFGTDKFNLYDLRNPFRHLTNYSVNKLGPGYAEMKDRVGAGCKWTLRQLRRYFQQSGIPDWLLWQRIASLVVLTALSHVSQVPPTINCFEFYGFDVLVDATLRPWLLEVNLSPALGNSCDADRAVKKPMLHDLFDLLGLPLYNTGLSVFNVWTDENCNSSESGSDEKLVAKRKSQVNVVSAAGKWSKKQRKHSDSASSSRNSADSTNPNCKTRQNETKDEPKLLKPKPKNLKAAPQNKTLVKTMVYKPNFSDPSSHSKEANDEMRKAYQYRTWGNGKNWSNAPSNEGGWVRICPINKSDKFTVKDMVEQITKFSKMAKDIPKQHPNLTESQWTEILKKSLTLTSELWMPDK